MRTNRKHALLLFALCAGCPAAVQATCQPHVEEQLNWETASLRPHSDAFQDCPVSESRYQQVIAEWLRQREGNTAKIRSLSLGRAIQYPWLSGYLVQAALNSPHWNAKRGRSVNIGENVLVANLLSAPEFLQRLQAPFEGSPYRVSGVSVEKVLVGRAAELLPDSGLGNQRAPYDAQVWLILQQISTSPAP